MIKRASLKKRVKNEIKDKHNGGKLFLGAPLMLTRIAYHHTIDALDQLPCTIPVL